MSSVDADRHVKQQKREAKQMREKARQAFDVGDFKTAAELNASVIAMSPDSEVARQSKREIENLKLDPMALYAGAIGVVFYALSWIVFY